MLECATTLKYNRLYNDLVHLWPLFDPVEDYVGEADLWKQVIREKLGPGRHRALDLGVGGGHLLSHLSRDIWATAIDISSGMLAHSIRTNPGVEHILDDMRSARLGRSFKAVLAHDAISYMRTEKDLSAVFATAKAHLDIGGIFVTVPDWYRETFKGTFVDYRTRISEGKEYTFIKYVTDPNPNDTTLETIFFYIIKDCGEVHVEEDRHVTGIFPLNTWIKLLSKEGFDVEVRPYPVYDDDDEGYLIVGRLADK